MNNYLDDLNSVQREAVIRTEGPALIIAGAGSGKTRVLTYRIAHLLNQGVKASSILALTFTNKAAREMKERINAVAGDQASRYLWMGTFHALFARILRIEHEAINYPSEFTIYDASDSKNLIKTITKDLQLDDKIYRTGVVASRISKAKNELISPLEYSQNDQIREFDRGLSMPSIADIYREYNRRCMLNKAMDFDDLLMRINMLFSDRPDILERYQQKFDYILVDEYQDTNYAQYLIISNLAKNHHNLCVVGDDAQSIYAFRGARIENILNFQNDYPNHKVFRLEQNYRSTQTIVNAANSIISHNERQLRKAVYSSREEGALIQLQLAHTDNEEGIIVAHTISGSISRLHNAYSDYAILYRTNAQSRIFEEALRKRNIPYKIYGGLSFYQRKEVKDLLAYFRVVINPADNEALKRIINYPARGIGQTTLAKLEKTALDNSGAILHTIGVLPDENPGNLNKGTVEKLLQFYNSIEHYRNQMTVSDAYTLARDIARDTGILKELYNDRSPEGVSRYQNIEELLNAIQEFSLSALEEGEPSGLEAYLQDVALLTDQDNEKEEDRNKVALMTVHSAKGLEFGHVFLVGLEENLFPSQQGGGNLTKTQLEEERRLFYVALTRAKEQVYLSYAHQRYKWGKPENCRPSSFLYEIDPAYIENAGLLKQPSRVIPGSRQFPAQENTGQFFQKSAPRKLTIIDEAMKNSIERKLTQLNQVSAASSNFQADSFEKIVPGSKVEHQRYGQGKVLQTEGSGPDTKATIFFHNAGQKVLLLRFARLKVIE